MKPEKPKPRSPSEGSGPLGPSLPSIGGCQGGGDLYTPLTGLKVLHEEVKLLLRKELEPWKQSTF